jgi:hypothetical protein
MGRFSLYFCCIWGGMKRPPRKWKGPLKKEAAILGAERETRVWGWRADGLRGPFSTSHPLGMSIDTTGTEGELIRSCMNGSISGRKGGLKLKPNRPSTRRHGFFSLKGQRLLIK